MWLWGYLVVQKLLLLIAIVLFLVSAELYLLFLAVLCALLISCWINLSEYWVIICHLALAIYTSVIHSIMNSFIFLQFFAPAGTILNELPTAIRESNTLVTFKRRLKTNLTFLTTCNIQPALPARQLPAPQIQMCLWYYKNVLYSVEITGLTITRQMLWSMVDPSTWVCGTPPDRRITIAFGHFHIHRRWVNPAS